MLQEFQSHNHSDEEQNPTGGYATAEGIDIRWQHGPLGTDPHTGEPAAPNGAFVETVLAIALDRLNFFQDCGAPEGAAPGNGKFACLENAEAIAAINDALGWLNKRTERRTEQGIEGTHTPDPVE